MPRTRSSSGSRPGAISKPKVLLIGHAGIPTGFCRVLNALEKHLGSAFDVHRIAANTPAAISPSLFAASDAHPARPVLPLDADSMLRFAYDLQPSLCLIVDEPESCAHFVANLRRLNRPPRVVCYCAADEQEMLSGEILSGLAHADRLVCFTRHAQGLLTQAFRRQQLAAPPITVIPHGIDTDGFHRMPQSEARRIFFAGTPLPQDAFIVLNANRNQPFKRVDLTVEGFALFARGKPDSVRLYLHMGTRPTAPGETALVDRLGIRRRLLTPAAIGSVHPSLDDSRLNLLYNSCDVGINTADREGWGMVAFEHAAAGAPQIMPALPSLSELWRGSALLLPVSPSPSPQIPARIAPAASPQSVADALELLYRDPSARAHWFGAALANVQRPEYAWPRIALQWTELFHALLA
jgi:D-inositol-3-phosphate glycosyltransferase